MVEFMQHGTTIAPQAYCETLKNCVGSFGTKVVECWMRCHARSWQYESANEYDQFPLGVFLNLPYSPDLALSDYYLFARTYLKNWLLSVLFNNNEDLMEGVRMWLSSQAAVFFDRGIHKLHQYEQCLNSGCLFRYIHVSIYNEIMFAISCLVNISPKVNFRITLYISCNCFSRFCGFVSLNSFNFKPSSNLSFLPVALPV
jgi:hypothetical protein